MNKARQFVTNRQRKRMAIRDMKSEKKDKKKMSQYISEKILETLKDKQYEGLNDQLLPVVKTFEDEPEETPHEEAKTAEFVKDDKKVEKINKPVAKQEIGNFDMFKKPAKATPPKIV